jgi:hypothetical protein
MKTARGFFLALVCAAATVAAEASAPSPQIVRVSIEQGAAAGSSTFVHNLQGRRLDKFIQDDGAQSLRCDVAWVAPPDAWVVLDYRLPKSLESRSVRARAQGDGKTAFFLQVPSGVTGDAIAWRARIVRGDEVLTERKSSLWR